MSAENRLPEPYGSLLDRQQPLKFRFEGREFAGFNGDTIASALAANGQWLLSRSFKYHRPRGVLTMSGHDANTLVQLPASPNTLADTTVLVDGMKVHGQNYSGSLAHDRNRLLGRFSRFMPVGFYYHAFYRPRGLWNHWSRLFRRKAGLGVIDTSFETDAHDKQYAFCDVAVIGAGRAGLQAALDAAQQDADVWLIDDQAMLGGALNYARGSADGRSESVERARLVAAVSNCRQITVMTDATANGWYADNYLSVIRGSRMIKLRAGRVVLCTGMLEQHAVFRNNDLPGIMMGTAAQRLIKLYAVRPGRNAVVLAGNDDAYGVALDLNEAGVTVVAIVDCRKQMSSDARRQAAADLGIEILQGHTVYSAIERGAHLSGVELRKIVAQGECENRGAQIACDLLCMSVGFMPAYQLACQAGATLSYDDRQSVFDIEGLPAGVEFVSDRAASNHPWPMFPHPYGREFVDLDEDLQVRDIVDSTRLGYEHVQLVKRYSTCGMGPSQGRHSALPTARLVAAATGRTVGETGVTTARPPLAAETLGHCAGRRFYPAYRSGIHQRHVEAGATMLQAGAWYRPAYYGAVADSAIQAEASAVRNGVGLIDVSTLGGIEINGPDAALFLNRIYTFAYLKQQPGTLRYALMTNEAGIVIDDGVVCRLASERFYVTATTGGVDAVYRKMLQWNAEWRLRVTLTNVTSAFAAVNLAGPLSRQILQALCSDVDLDSDAFPYLAVREGEVAGIPAMLLRVGFVGELGYEIHVPQHSGEALWDALVESGRPAGIRPVGIEAQRLLRLEKGHVIVGQDTDAMSTPYELQMGWAIAKSKDFFVGGRSLEILSERPLKRMLAGFSCDIDGLLPKEGHLVVNNGIVVGRVTSCARSATLDRTIGLAYVSPEFAAPDTSIRIGVDDIDVEAITESLPFYDPDGKRQQL